MNELNVTAVDALDKPDLTSSPCNVYKPTDRLNVTGRGVTFMRIGDRELAVLKMLVDNEGEVRFKEVKEKLSGYNRLKFRRMGYDKYYEINSIHKSLVRATKTLEEKGLIERRGWEGNYREYSRIVFLDLTELGRQEYMKRCDRLTNEEKDNE